MTKLTPVLAALAVLLTGCSAATGNARGGGTVTIALGGPFSGPDRAIGTQIRAGAQLAADQINAADGISAGPRKGARIEFVEYDDADQPARAAANARRYVDDQRIDAFVGSGLSDASIAAAPIAGRAGLPYLSAYASSEKILTAARGAQSVFVVPPTFPAYAFSVTDELLAAGHRRPAVLHLQGSYGDGVASWCDQRLRSRGVPPVATESFVAGDTDMRAQLARIRADGADSLLMVGLPDSDALILKQAHQIGLAVAFFDPGGITNSETFLHNAGDLANGVVGNTPDAPALSAKAKELHAAYQKATGESVLPDPAAFTYEAVTAVAAAYAAGASGRDDLAEQLHRVQLKDTGIGSLRFADDGSRLGGRLYVFTIEGGKPKFRTGYEQTGPTSVERIELPK